MKKADWIFLLIAAGLAWAVWYFFIRPGTSTPLIRTSMAAAPDQNKIAGNGTVIPDASDFAAGHYNVDYSSLYP